MMVLNIKLKSKNRILVAEVLQYAVQFHVDCIIFGSVFPVGGLQRPVSLLRWFTISLSKDFMTTGTRAMGL